MGGRGLVAVAAPDPELELEVGYNQDLERGLAYLLTVGIDRCALRFAG